jgi:fatty acid kinase fatty acid binding subunit
MPGVAIVTDTTAYAPSELLEANGVRVVSLYVNFGAARTEREADIADYDRFFDELRSAEELPTTSQPSVGDFLSVYEPLLAAGREIVSIHIAGGLSGTPEAARQAKEALDGDGADGDRVHVLDSTTAAGGLGLVVLAAAHRAEDSSATGAEVLEAAKQARASLKMWFAIDTLEFLKRGGRIGAASAWIGSTLKIKPILSVENEITPVERVRTSGRAFERMVDYARQRRESDANAWVVQHIQAPHEAELLADRCREIFERQSVFTSEIGPVLGVHTGPGLLGVGSIDARFFESG